VTAREIEVLDRIQGRVLWLAAWMVHHANHGRPDAEGIKVGGHQASSASLVTILTALYFKALGPGDVVALKAHAAPAFYAIQYLRGRLPAGALGTLRAFGGLQAYPSRRKNPEVVDLSTGSMGLGAVAASFGALTARYLADHGGRRVPERFVVLVGDAELDEGNVWEALLEEALARQDRLLWIVDLNRQSLDRVTPGTRRAQLGGMFRAAGWRVIECRWGARLRALFEVPGGGALRRRLEAMPQAEYQALLRLPPAAVRKALVADGPGGAPVGEVDALLVRLPDEALPGLLADLGGHDLAAVLGALDEARDHPGPAVILADTVKGWGLPIAGDPLNHGALMTGAQIEALRDRLGISPGQEWAGFAPVSPEGRWIAGLPPLFRPPRSRAPAVEIPERVEEAWGGRLSTQEAFGRVLGALARLPAGDRIVTVSADVAVTTHLAAWINRRGAYFPEARPDFFESLPQPLRWRESPAGQHIELGIAEHNLFLLLGALGLSHELSGQTLLPIGTLYDPFVSRGLDALHHALYAGGRFIVVATPSGVSLAPEGGAHQSVVTPPLGIALPDLRYAEPAFAREVEWWLLDGLRRLAARGESLYLRLSTRPVDQSLAPPDSPALRDAVLRGGYRLVDGRAIPGWSPEEAVHLFAMGATVPEAVRAAGQLAAEGVAASVFVVTSPDLLYRGMRERRPWLLDLVSAEEEEVPVVSVLDGHSQTLAFLGSALGVPQVPLGVDHFGQSGALGDLYRHYGLDADAIAGAARLLLGRRPGPAP
jgi:pyruvate dehydrogenase E1 component